MKILEQVIQVASQQKKKSFFVFDMDSTLFCMKWRTQAIVQYALKDREFRKRFSEECKKAKKVKVSERDWALEDIMCRLNFARDEPFVRALKKNWEKHFFSNEWLKWDRPYKGAVRFVQKIFQSGGEVYYLTGRSRQAMHEGTVESLNAWRFPLKSPQNLIMKENPAEEDAYYKTERLKKLIKQCDTLLFFENEPVILNEVHKNLPQIQLFWMDSAHSGRESPPPSAKRLSMNYHYVPSRPGR